MEDMTRFQGEDVVQVDYVFASVVPAVWMRTVFTHVSIKHCKRRDPSHCATMGTVIDATLEGK